MFIVDPCKMDFSSSSSPPAFFFCGVVGRLPQGVAAVETEERLGETMVSSTTAVP